MWRHILTIAWAQWRVLRNHLPRTTLGSLLGFSISLIWYGGFATFAVFIAVSLPSLPVGLLQKNLGPALMALFLIWQLVPLLTLSGGWSLDLKKLQVYPIGSNTLLAAEAFLRITGSVEMLLLTLAAAAGLMFHPGLRAWCAAGLLLYIPFNLLISVFVRESVSRLLQRNRIRELLTILFILVAVLPQFLVRLGYIKQSGAAFKIAGRAPFSPWSGVASLSLGTNPAASLLIIIGWLVFAYWIAHRQLTASLRVEEPRGAAAPLPAAGSKRNLTSLLEAPARFFADPVSAMITKEIRTLLRMPRFRVVFALATVITVVVVFPLTINGGISLGPKGIVVSLMEAYGIVILGDALLWNIFGFDGKAAQLYFVSPVDISLVFRAKNIAATLFVCLQCLVVLAAGTVIRVTSSPIVFVIAVLSAAVLAVYFIAVGNVSSVVLARGIDPRATMKKQAGAKVQFWIFGCMLGAGVLLGFAFLAGWAVGNDWGTVGVLAFEFGIGLLLYRFSIESAVRRALTEREEFLMALSKGGAPVGS